MINVENLKPFPKFCYTIGMIPTSYKESLTYEEQLLWFCDFLQNTVIPTVNNNGQAVQELQNLYIELKSYVDNYFENLDVQAEINNKLDKMTEDGQLADIIANYIQLKGILAYNSVQDMKEATNLVNGSFAETYGFYNTGDGGSAKYKIRNKTNDDTVDDITIIELANNLIAELIINSDMNIKQFGAKGDNLNNDTNNFKIALSKLLNGRLYISSGTYLIYESLNLQPNTSLIGENKGNTILKYNTYETSSSNHWLLNCNNISNISLENITLQGLKIENDTSLPTNMYYYGLSFIDSSNLFVNNCIFKDFYANGISLRNSNIVLIQNSLFENNSTNGIAGTKSLDNIKILNNSFKNNLYQNINFEDNDSSHIVKNVIVSNNIIENDSFGLSTWGISFISPTINNELLKYKNIIIQNNTIKNINSGITLHFSENVKVLNNNILECNSAIKLNADLVITLKMKNIIIENNLLNVKSNSNRALIINKSTNVKVLNNDISGGSSTSTSSGSVIISYSSFVDIIENTIHDASLFGINIINESSHINIFNNLFSNGYLTFIRVNLNGDIYLHCDNNFINDEDSALTYTVRFQNGTTVNYVILERFMSNPSSLYNSSEQLGTNCVVRNNQYSS